MSRWIIRKYKNDADYQAGRWYEFNIIYGNCLLNEGIAALLNLLIGAAETSFAQANAYVGVGDSATGAGPTQTGLLAETNKIYVACDASYPQISGQKVTWRGVFDGDTGNFAWNEFTVASGNSNAADNLNRKVSAEGTKTAGQTWTVDLEITFS
jgi:hypothetical protein